MEVEVGDLIVIAGDHSDSTECYDGLTAKVEAVYEYDILVHIAGEGHWLIWKYNIREVIKHE